MFVSFDKPPLTFFDPEVEDEAMASIREVRDLRFTGDDKDGDDGRVRGVAFRDEGESSDSALPSCWASCSFCCLARAAAAAEPAGGGGVGILDPEATGTGLLSDIFVRWLAQAPVIERFMLLRGRTWSVVLVE